MRPGDRETLGQPMNRVPQRAGRLAARPELALSSPSSAPLWARRLAFKASVTPCWIWPVGGLGERAEGRRKVTGELVPGVPPARGLWVASSAKEGHPPLPSKRTCPTFHPAALG